MAFLAKLFYMAVSFLNSESCLTFSSSLEPTPFSDLQPFSQCPLCKQSYLLNHRFKLLKHLFSRSCNLKHPIFSQWIKPLDLFTYLSTAFSPLHHVKYP